jgi:hypothetical protein
MAKKYEYRKEHLIRNKDYPRSLCGRRVARRVCTTVKDFEDYGFDGDIKDLCEHCQKIFDEDCKLFTKAIEQCVTEVTEQLKREAMLRAK